MKIKKVFKVSWFERWAVIDAMEKLGYRILSRKSKNPTLKILIDCSVLRNDFENRVLKSYSNTTTKNKVKILQ